MANTVSKTKVPALLMEEHRDPTVLESCGERVEIVPLVGSPSSVRGWSWFSAYSRSQQRQVLDQSLHHAIAEVLQPPSHFITCDARRWCKAFSGSSSGGVLLPALLLHLASEVHPFYHCLPTLVSTLCFYRDGGTSWCCTTETVCLSCSVVGPWCHGQELSSTRCLCVSRTSHEC